MDDLLARAQHVSLPALTLLMANEDAMRPRASSHPLTEPDPGLLPHRLKRSPS